MKRILSTLLVACALSSCGDTHTENHATKSADTPFAPTPSTSVRTDKMISEEEAIERGFPKGKLFDIGPAAGTPMAVVGVAQNDQLNFRAQPSHRANIVATAKALVDAPVIYSAGQGWLLEGGGSWWNVSIGGARAWANTKYLKSLGDTKMLASEPLPIGGRQDAFIETFIDHKISSLETAKAVIVQPLTGLDAQGAVTTIDILGYQDDALAGERFRILFQYEVDATGETLKIISTTAVVHVTPLCSRGVEDGMCL